MTENKPAKGRFQPGQSGNPGGVPKVTLEIKALARSYCARAIERLAELIDSPDERVAVAAATAILDRGIGKPGQAIELSGPDGAPLGGRLDLTGISAELFRELQEKALKKGEGENG